MQDLNPHFVEQIRLLYPGASESFFAAMAEPAYTAIRYNPFKKIECFPNSSTIAWCSEGRILQERPSFTGDPLFHAGTYYVQESSSMFLHHALQKVFQLLRPEQSALKILDVCAAPGGKSTLINSLMEPQDFLLANEIIKSRFPVLRENLQKWGNMNYACSSLDPKSFQSIPSFFDILVVDAPCSGEGLFRKDPTAMKEWSPEAVELCAGRQKRILADVLPTLKPGGIVIYSTCTFNRQEDEEQIQYLLDKGYESIPLDVPETWQIESCENHSYKFPFHLQKGEGFFICCLMKPNETENKVHYKQHSLNYCNKNISAEFRNHLLEEHAYAITNYGSMYYAMKEMHTAIFEILSSNGIIQTAGLPLGELDKKKNLIPDHALAVSNDKSIHTASIELSIEEAKLYLRKQNFMPDATEQGWYLANYRGFSLGWMKMLGNRMNNYLPSSYRVLKDL